MTESESNSQESTQPDPGKVIPVSKDKMSIGRDYVSGDYAGRDCGYISPFAQTKFHLLDTIDFLKCRLAQIGAFVRFSKDSTAQSKTKENVLTQIQTSQIDESRASLAYLLDVLEGPVSADKDKLLLIASDLDTIDARIEKHQAATNQLKECTRQNLSDVAEAVEKL